MPKQKHTKRLRSSRFHRFQRRASLRKNPFRLFRLHPLFLLVGVWYALTGELFLFFLSALVAVQHECAHAFAASKLGYRLNAIVLMPYGAIIDGDLKGISFQDEIFVALCGPLCNFITAVFFVAIWWFAPTMYAFTDVAFYSSLSVALVNLLPAYPLDGGRILYCLLARAFAKTRPEQAEAERKAKRVCRAVTFLFFAAFLTVFITQCIRRQPNITMLAFALFLLFGGIGNQDRAAVYEKIDFSYAPHLNKGVEIKRVAVGVRFPVKDVFRFLARGSYLVLEVYDEKGEHAFNLSQNELSALFSVAKTPYDTLYALKTSQNCENNAKNAQFYL